MLKNRSDIRVPQRLSAPVVLAGGLVALCLYAAFAHGAVAAGDEERLQLAIAAIGVAAGIAWLWSGALRIGAPPIGWIALGLMVAFAAWSGVSLEWSVAPDQTWIECNRVIAYTIVLALAFGLGASDRRAAHRLADGFAIAALLVSAYALAQKLAPGIRIAGVLDLDRTGSLPRLQDPLGYWNALGAFVAMGVAPMLTVVIDIRRDPRLRLAATTAVLAMLVTIGFTYSRGALLALAGAMAIVVLGGGGGGGRLRALGWLGMCVVAALPAAVIGLASAPLTTAGASLGARERAGAELLVVLVASGLLLALSGRRAIALESRFTLSAARRRMLARALPAGAGVLVLAGLLALALSSRGLGGSVSHAWHSFTSTRTTAVSDPGRLLSADSENRWVWWKEAVGAFSARPLTGWGAGSFGVVHLLFRRDTLSVQQPHSLPLQFLAETGIVGAALALTALGLLLVGAARAVRRSDGRARPAALALSAAAVTWAVHSLYDWDWDIPALTVPALLFLGTLVGSLAPPGVTESRRLAWRGAGCVAATACLTVFAVSAIIPPLAASDADGALLAASGSGRSGVHGALAQALAAGRLDPLSDAGLRDASTIALRRGDPRLARRLLASAVRRQPTDGQAWQQLAFVYVLLGDSRSALIAARRELALDPRGPLAASVAARAMLSRAPPAGSATAGPTAGRAAAVGDS